MAQVGPRKKPRAKPAPSGSAGACFAGPSTTRSAAGLPAGVSPQLAAARRDYLVKLEGAQEAEAAELRHAEIEKALPRPPGELDAHTRKALDNFRAGLTGGEQRARDLASSALYAREAADTAFGVFARLAHEEGYRACLCGKLEKAR